MNDTSSSTLGRRVDRSSCRRTRRAIGDRLRQRFDETAELAVPDDFLELLRTADRQRATER